MNKFVRLSLMTLISMGIVNTALASEEVTEQKPIMLKAETNAANMEMVVKDNYVKAKYASAENRFLQGNVKASHDDYADLISKATHDDYVFLAYGMKMAEYGFFDLSEELITKLDNNLYTKNYVKDIRKFYYPTAMVNVKDTLYLADAYASIVYNNLAIETTSELLNSVQAAESDYKNYLIALGFYKSNNLVQALKYIDNAIMQIGIHISLSVHSLTKYPANIPSKIVPTKFPTMLIIFTYIRNDRYLSFISSLRFCSCVFSTSTLNLFCSKQSISTIA